MLCSMLGSRLFKADPEAAGTSSSDQQPATMQHIDQVCTRPSTFRYMHRTVKPCVAGYVATTCLMAVACRSGQQLCASRCPCKPITCRSLGRRTVCHVYWRSKACHMLHMELAQLVFFVLPPSLLLSQAGRECASGVLLAWIFYAIWDALHKHVCCRALSTRASCSEESVVAGAGAAAL